MDDLRVFSAGVVRISSRAIGTGQLAAHPPIQTPARPIHAAETNAQVTLCGLDVALLREFPHDVYGRLNSYNRCDDCDHAAGHPDS